MKLFATIVASIFTLVLGAPEREPGSSTPVSPTPQAQAALETSPMITVGLLNWFNPSQLRLLPLAYCRKGQWIARPLTEYEGDLYKEPPKVSSEAEVLVEQLLKQKFFLTHCPAVVFVPQNSDFTNIIESRYLGLTGQLNCRDLLTYGQGMMVAASVRVAPGRRQVNPLAKIPPELEAAIDRAFAEEKRKAAEWEQASSFAKQLEGYTREQQVASVLVYIVQFHQRPDSMQTGKTWIIEGLKGLGLTDESLIGLPSAPEAQQRAFLDAMIPIIDSIESGTEPPPKYQFLPTEIRKTQPLSLGRNRVGHWVQLVRKTDQTKIPRNGNPFQLPKNSIVYYAIVESTAGGSVKVLWEDLSLWAELDQEILAVRDFDGDGVDEVVLTEGAREYRGYRFFGRGESGAYEQIRIVSGAL